VMILVGACIIELGTASSLLVRPSVGLALVLVILLTYSGALAQLPRSESCRCFGIRHQISRNAALARNAFLLVLSMTTLLIIAMSPAKDFEVLTASGVGIVCVILASVGAWKASQLAGGSMRASARGGDSYGE
jgi:hypothetical protein